MDKLLDISAAFDTVVNGSLGFLLDNEWLSNILRLCLLMYSGLAAPNLHPTLRELFDNYVFRVVILTLVIWTANNNPTMSIVLSMVFIASLNRMNSKGLFELFGGIFVRDHDRDAMYYREDAKRSKRKSNKRRKYQFASGEDDVMY